MPAPSKASTPRTQRAQRAWRQSRASTPRAEEQQTTARQEQTQTQTQPQEENAQSKPQQQRQRRVSTQTEPTWRPSRASTPTARRTTAEEEQPRRKALIPTASARSRRRASTLTVPMPTRMERDQRRASIQTQRRAVVGRTACPSRVSTRRAVSRTEQERRPRTTMIEHLRKASTPIALITTRSRAELASIRSEMIWSRHSTVQPSGAQTYRTNSLYKVDRFRTRRRMRATRASMRANTAACVWTAAASLTRMKP
mmetsp:Transcript_21383/g.50690  ORF Transcript_21383/g.50690 Transcript_21383/m.50690 type:complete len:255 (+) Transcript_21383:250-1014(+)